MYSESLRRNYSHGFTLVELVVALAIIVSFSAFFLINLRAGGSGTSARRQVANKIVSDIRRAQSKALSGTRGNTACGYGIHFVDPGTYYLFSYPPPSSP